jgi:hypothetical protein
VKALSSESRLTANMLVLELSTMIVAIALAFNAQSLEASRLTFVGGLALQGGEDMSVYRLFAQTLLWSWAQASLAGDEPAPPRG